MKIDLKKELKHLYSPSTKEVETIDVPEMNFLMVDGRGDPNNSLEFQQAIEVLYGVSFTLKFALKKSDKGQDYVVLPSEGLWWSDDPSGFDMNDKSKWKWTLMVAQPGFATRKDVEDAIEQLRLKKNPAALEKLRFEIFKEGLSAQIMHIGPYAAELPTIEALHKFVSDNGYKLRGKHHEIYLGDPHRTAPEKLKTVLRNPIEKA